MAAFSHMISVSVQLDLVIGYLSCRKHFLNGTCIGVKRGLHRLTTNDQNHEERIDHKWHTLRS
jgi:hypothetical protein